MKCGANQLLIVIDKVNIDWIIVNKFYWQPPWSQVSLLCNHCVANSKVVVLRYRWHEQKVLCIKLLHIIFFILYFGLDRRMVLLSSWTLSISTVASALLTLYSLCIVGVAIHRLYFSRYAKFPDLKLAGMTYGCMFYYDAISGKGQYMHRIKEMHEEYSTWYTKPSYISELSFTTTTSGSLWEGRYSISN